MLSLTSVSASEVVIGDVADNCMPPCQRVHAMTATLARSHHSARAVGGMAERQPSLSIRRSIRH